MKITSQKDITNLKKYLAAVYAPANHDRMERCKYFDAIMRPLHGDVSYAEDDADLRREKAEAKGLLTALPDQLARFGEAAVREMANDLVGIIMPVDTPYAAVGDPEDKEKINTLIGVCRTFATHHGHRSNAIDAVYNCLTLQHFFVEGRYEHEDEMPEETEYSGVAYRSIDPYAAFWDTGSPLRRAYLKGAVMGWHETVSATEVYMDVRDNEDYELPDKEKPQNHISIGCPNNFMRSYRKDYKHQVGSPSVGGTGVDVYDMLSAFGDAATSTNHLVRTIMYLRIPSEVLRGISEMTTHRLTFINGTMVHIEAVAPARQGFPITAGNLFLDHDHRSYRSYGEHGADLTKLVSAYINLVKRGMRREAVGGTTFVDKRLTQGGKPLHEAVSESTQFVEVSVPASANQEKGLGSYILSVGGERSGNRMGELGAMTELFTGRMFPRSSKADLVGLDRATAMHASLAASAADSTLMAIAILMDDAIGVPWRRLLKNLIIANTNVIKLADARQQTMLVLEPSDLRTLEFDFTTSQPVAGFDRNRVLLTVQNVMNTLVQTPQVQENPALIQEILDYYMSVGTAGTVTLRDLNASLFQNQQEAAANAAVPGADPTITPEAGL